MGNLIRGGLGRRTLLKSAAGAAAVLGLGATPLRHALGADPIKVGLMLPYSGTFAKLGENITFAVEMLLAEKGGMLGGRPIEFVKLDDESDPAKAPENANRLVSRDEVDVIIGTVHSGVQMGMVKVVKESGTLLISPNAGAGAMTGELCAPNIFRASFSNWQPSYGMGKSLADRGVKKVAYVTWDYAAGKESMQGFADGLATGGGTIVQALTLPFPETSWQPLLAQIPGLGVEAVGTFFAGGGAVQFVKDYAAAGLRDKFPLYGSGFLTEGVLAAQGDAAEGLETALHYADGLNTDRDNAFRAAFLAKTQREADVYAVQGYDAAQLLAIGLEAVGGDVEQQDAMIAAMAAATIPSPRGDFTLSKSHNPVQDIYLRKATGGKNMVAGIAAPKLADPATGCSMT
jgi:branched-chain amino acid transport system substrate-binding protein